jgi:cytochrome b
MPAIPAHCCPGCLSWHSVRPSASWGCKPRACIASAPLTAGLGSAVQATSQQLGGSLGLAVLVTIALRYALALSGHGVATLAATADGYALAMRLAAAAQAETAGQASANPQPCRAEP